MADALDPNTQWLSGLFKQPTPNSSGQGAIDAYGRQVGAAAAQGGLFAGNQGIGMSRSYVDDYQPYDKKYMSYVDSIGTDAYRANERGRAMTSVQQQGDAAQETLRRQAMASGVNYGDPKFAFMQGQNANQTAHNKVMAAMASDRSARDEWSKGLGAINAMGLKVGELGLKNMGMAGDLAKVGMAGMDLGAAAQDRGTQANAASVGAQAAQTNAGANAANSETNAQNSIWNRELGLGRLALDRYNIDTGNALKTRAMDDAADANSFGNTFLSSMGGAATNWLVNGGLNKVGSGVKNLFGNSDIGGSALDTQDWTYSGGGTNFAPADDISWIYGD